MKSPFNEAAAKAGQAAWAKHLGTRVETTNSVGMRMTLIPPGEFLMGSTPEQVAAAKKIGEDEKLPPNDRYFASASRRNAATSSHDQPAVFDRHHRSDGSAVSQVRRGQQLRRRTNEDLQVGTGFEEPRQGDHGRYGGDANHLE